MGLKKTETRQEMVQQHNHYYEEHEMSEATPNADEVLVAKMLSDGEGFINDMFHRMGQANVDANVAAKWKENMEAAMAALKEGV